MADEARADAAITQGARVDVLIDGVWLPGRVMSSATMAVRLDETRRRDGKAYRNVLPVAPLSAGYVQYDAIRYVGAPVLSAVETRLAEHLLRMGLSAARFTQARSVCSKTKRWEAVARRGSRGGYSVLLSGHSPMRDCAARGVVLVERGRDLVVVLAARKEARRAWEAEQRATNGARS